MTKYRVHVYRLVCSVCDKPFESTRLKEPCHPRCREEWYRTYHRKYYAAKYKGRATRTRAQRARSCWHIKEQPCAACAYPDITREIELPKIEAGTEGAPDTFVMAKAHLCPTHLTEYRCGMLEAWTWRRVDVLAESAAPAAAAEVTKESVAAQSNSK